MNRLLFVLVPVLSVAFTTGLWAVDIGASSMVMAASTNHEIVVNGLGWSRTPMDHYHIGLIMALLSFISLVVLLSFCLLKPDNKVKKNG